MLHAEKLLELHLVDLSCSHQVKCEMNTRQNLLNHVSALFKISFKTRTETLTDMKHNNGSFIFLGGTWKIKEIVDTVVNTFCPADYVRALTRELVYRHVFQSHHDGLRGASSGSRTPSVFITSLPGRKREGCHGQMHCNLLC